MKKFMYILFVLSFSEWLCAQEIQTVCNPVNLSYRFCLDQPSRREAADPSVILFKGEYYMFVSKSGGYFHSTDLIHWDLITSDDLPVEAYAPTVVAIGDMLYFAASRDKGLYKTSHPKDGKWEFVREIDSPYIDGDPMFFLDEDGRLYFYGGCSGKTPIYGVEYDPKTFELIGEKVPLIYQHREKYGWEVKGDYNTIYDSPGYIEGSWLTKHQGKYYLQYAVPGTDYKSYCDGMYVSNHPLGPYTLAANNPFALKSGGFVSGGGHGSSFQDVYGNNWHYGTVSISVRKNFERRLVLFPVFFDEDGEPWANTGFGDYPMIVPNHKITSPENIFPNWMLLSYQKPVVASSTLDGYPVQNAVDENIRTWWSAATGNAGEYFSIDMGRLNSVYSIQLNFADQDANLIGKGDGTYYQYIVEQSTDGKKWKTLIDKSKNTSNAPHDYIQLPQPVKARYIRITNIQCPDGKFSLFDFRIFGKSNQKEPEAISSFHAERGQDRRMVHLSWEAVPGAIGYNIRYGTEKNKLYQNYLVYESNEITIRSLNAEKEYFFAIDAFNEGGITKGTVAQSQNQPPLYNDSHDITSLSSWGPYSKRYAGISHIPEISKGLRFDFSVMPGYYRNRQLVPHVLFESSYYPWNVTPDMKHITYRYELEWKDNVYMDVTYHILDESHTLVDVSCVNQTAVTQNLALNNMAYIDYPDDYPAVEAKNASSLQWYNAIDYTINEPSRKTPQYALVYDGWKRNEIRSRLALDGSLLGKGFGKNKGDKLVYMVDIAPGAESGSIVLRYSAAKGVKAGLLLKGLADKKVELEGTGDFALFTIPYTCSKAGQYSLEFISDGMGEITLDGFFVGKTADVNRIEIVQRPIPFTPVIEEGKEGKDFILKYADCDNYYGVSWNFSPSEIREVENDELESFFRRLVHNHYSKVLTGNKQGHYTNAFLRPIVLLPHSKQTHYLLLTTGGREQVASDLKAFHNTPQNWLSQIPKQPDTDKKILPEGEKYRFSQNLMQATLLSNIVYPVYTQREYIRHLSPGKNWNSLYTWDSGFLALGMTDVDPIKAFECIKAYTTPVGNESAFIHHGTPLPTQMFAFFDLWNNTYSREQLTFLYPRLKQYFDFMVGNNPNSVTQMKGSGLLYTWDYFYNSGGWDDYPPQKAKQNNPDLSVTPVVTSAYYLRAAKILRLAAKELGLKNDIKAYDKTIDNLSNALLKYSYDVETGYFSYVVHDEVGNAKEIFRYQNGENYNKGLDGVSPLVAGIGSSEQIERMTAHVFSPDEMWTDVGISTVDQSAAYYRQDGYWNGAVWFPHQWVIWKSMLDAGKGDLALKIAQTALNTWKKECDNTYYTFEHFIIASGRGAGWHQFTGLSSPVLNWFSSYYKIGKVSAGFEIWLKQNEFNSDYSGYKAQITFDDATAVRERCLLVCLNPKYHYSATFNGKPLKNREYYPGLLEITFPATNKGGMLSINKK